MQRLPRSDFDEGVKAEHYQIGENSQRAPLGYLEEGQMVPRSVGFRSDYFVDWDPV